MDAARLSVSNICKSYSTPVLKNVNLTIAAGEVHAIVGENGAGKTTLANILAGLVQKDDGKLVMDQVDYEPSSPLDGFNAGISYATQELSIVSTLSVGENVSLRNLPHKYFVIQRRRLARRARELLQLVGLEDISPDTLTENLSLAERQLVEFAKALASDCRLLILDEPTAALAGPQANRLHKIITDRAKSGTSVIYISHRLQDVLAVSDTVSILRDGQVVASAEAAGLSARDLINHMSGENYPAREITPRARQVKHSLLEVESITTRDLPHPISFTCSTGEIVGLAGLAGAGRSELMNALFGLIKLTSGSVCRVTKTGKIAVDNPTGAVRSGMGYLGEERILMGLFSGQSVVTNMMLPGIPPELGSLGLLDPGAERAAASDLVNRLSVRCSGLEQPVEQLSGGNQQKVLIARWLHCDSEILLLDEPTRGVDVGTKSAIYDLLFEMQSNNKTIVIASSDIEELMIVCSRILVLSDRKLVREFAPGNWSETDILAAAFQEFSDRSTVRDG